jgi:periplasmic protein TonB
MAQVAPLAPTSLAGSRSSSRPRELRFECLLLNRPEDAGKGLATTFSVSFFIHTLLVIAIVLVPLLTYDVLPAPGEAVRAFFVEPSSAAPPPPPPPPAPAAGARPMAKAPAAPTPIDAKFTAPVEVPDQVKPEEGLEITGAGSGVVGGVEGGVPGGVVGGIVGGLPTEAPPPPPKAVRVGGQIKQPKLLQQVKPNFPELAAQARLSAIVIMEALVDTQGRVKSVTVLRGAPLFDEAAMEAVKQWRYQPLLLNGVPTDFILTVTINFNLSTASKQ